MINNNKRIIQINVWKPLSKVVLSSPLAFADTRSIKKADLVATDQYLKAGIHIGTKFRTKYMQQFIYKTRPDGLSVLNLQKIDQRIRIAADFLGKYAPKDLLVVSRRENGWKAVKKFGKLTGAKVFPGRYPPGILTNPNLEIYIETPPPPTLL